MQACGFFFAGCNTVPCLQEFIAEGSLSHEQGQYSRKKI